MEPHYIFGEKSGTPRVWSEHRRPALTIMPGGFRRVHGRHSKRQVEAADPGRLVIENRSLGLRNLRPSKHLLPNAIDGCRSWRLADRGCERRFNLDHVDVVIARSRMSGD